MGRELLRVCVYAGSNAGHRPEYVEAAAALGRLLAEQRIELVYGGGRVGLMGSVSQAVLDAGGRVTGIIPHGLMKKELAHPGVDNMIVVDSMHERKARMAELADAFITLPGGYGTLEETVEILTWGQLGIHHKPCGLLNVAGFYDGLIAALDHFAAEGLLRELHRSLLLTDTDPRRLLEQMRDYVSPVTEHWLRRDQA